MRILLVVGCLLAAAAGAQSPSPDLFWQAGVEFEFRFPTEVECPKDWGPITVKAPLGYGYETVEIEYGLVVEAEKWDGEP